MHTSFIYYLSDRSTLKYLQNLPPDVLAVKSNGTIVTVKRMALMRLHAANAFVGCCQNTAPVLPVLTHRYMIE